MTAIIAPQLDGEFASGVAFYTERLDSDAPYSDRATADRAAQAEALRLVHRKAWAPGNEKLTLAQVLHDVARELGFAL